MFTAKHKPKSRYYWSKRKKEITMSSEEAEQLMDAFEKWDSHAQKREFISRMERKLHRKERTNRS
jgi:transcription elongation GreA/GreB family factor